MEGRIKVNSCLHDFVSCLGMGNKSDYFDKASNRKNPNSKDSQSSVKWMAESETVVFNLESFFCGERGKPL
jgi:hypothetical protein